MKIFAVSDLHVDYEENRYYVNNLDREAYKDDILILAGDLTDDIFLLEKAFKVLKGCFREVLYVPGNHDLWVHRYKDMNSMDKLDNIKSIAYNCGIVMKPFHCGSLSIVPLFGWYDYSFGRPSEDLVDSWADFSACKWPAGFNEKAVTDYFISMNEAWLDIRNVHVISFSHFLPRIDIMPSYIPLERRGIYPVLGSKLLEKQIRLLKPEIHIYGHSHVNMCVTKENIKYINNAFGYPYEKMITAKQLKCIFEI